ncbi:MAG TPA: hypothetical protein VGM31_14225 [Puia sp.]
MMRTIKILFALFLSLILTQAQAQFPTFWSNKIFTPTQYDYVNIAKGAIMPADTAANAPIRSLAVIDGKVYVKGSSWWTVAGSDTTSLSQRINIKRDVLDTAYAHHLQTRERGQQIADSLGDNVARNYLPVAWTSSPVVAGNSKILHIVSGVIMADMPTFRERVSVAGNNITLWDSTYGQGGSILVLPNMPGFFLQQSSSAGHGIHVMMDSISLFDDGGTPIYFLPNGGAKFQGHVAGVTEATTDSSKFLASTQLLHQVLGGFVTGDRLADSLNRLDVFTLQRPLYFFNNGTDSGISVKNDSAAWNAKALQGIAISPTTPTNGQAMLFDLSSSSWKPGTVASGATNIGTAPSPTSVSITSSSGSAGTFPLADNTNAGALAPGLHQNISSYTHFNTSHVSGANNIAYGVASPDSVVFRDLLLANNGGILIDTTLSYQQLLRYGLKLDTNYSALQAYVANHAGGGFSSPLSALGDIMYGASGGAATRLAGNTSTTMQALVQTGTGSVSAIPAWHTFVKSDVGLGSVENTALSTWTGNTSIASVGTIGTGTWDATAIAAGKGGAPTGGTTDQVLTKNSSTSYDYSWKTPSSGFSDPMTTMGDIIIRNASNVTARLAGNTTAGIQFLSQTGTGSASAAPVWHTLAKSDIGLGSVENTALSTWAGSANITTVGSIGSGTWHSTVIGTAYGGTGASSLTGIPKANGASAWTVAIASDFPTLNQSTTGNAATATNLAGAVLLPTGITVATPTLAAQPANKGYVDAAISGAVPTLSSGVYTPTVTSTLNFSPSGTALGFYLKVDSIVYVSVKIFGFPGSAGDVGAAITLPIATTLNGNDLYGSGITGQSTSPNIGTLISGIPGANKAQASFTTLGTDPCNGTYHFFYIVH